MDLQTYVVACNADPTCIVVAESKEDAEKMARLQADEDLGDCDTCWKAYEINEYFSSEYEPYFFGWVKHAEQNYV